MAPRELGPVSIARSSHIHYASTIVCAIRADSAAGNASPLGGGAKRAQLSQHYRCSTDGDPTWRVQRPSRRGNERLPSAAAGRADALQLVPSEDLFWHREQANALFRLAVGVDDRYFDELVELTSPSQGEFAAWQNYGRATAGHVVLRATTTALSCSATSVPLSCRPRQGRPIGRRCSARVSRRSR